MFVNLLYLWTALFSVRAGGGGGCLNLCVLYMWTFLWGRGHVCESLHAIPVDFLVRAGGMSVNLHTRTTVVFFYENRA